MSRGLDKEAVRAAVSLKDVAGLDWDLRKSDPRRQDWWACCPFHGEASPSFHIFRTPEGERFKCFGCGAGGDVFAYVMARDGLSFVEALTALAAGAHLSKAARAPAAKPAPPPRRPEEDGGLRAAARIWDEALPMAAGQDIEAYLGARGVDMRALLIGLGGAPASLRLHPNLPYLAERRTVYQGPAMIGRIERRGQFVGIHRTWITPAGRKCLAGGTRLDKRWLGARGQMAGGEIRFGTDPRRIVVGEGIETVLAALSRLLGAGRDYMGVAALSLGNLAGSGNPAFAGDVNPFDGRVLPSPMPDWSAPGWLAPEDCEDIVILAEGSAKNPMAAERMAMRALRRHQVRRDGTRRRARLALPGGAWDKGLDFADLAAE